jgi:hypothetical protein
VYVHHVYLSIALVARVGSWLSSTPESLYVRQAKTSLGNGEAVGFPCDMPLSNLLDENSRSTPTCAPACTPVVRETLLAQLHCIVLGIGQLIRLGQLEQPILGDRHNAHGHAPRRLDAAAHNAQGTCTSRDHL